MKKVFLCILIVLTLFTGVACNNNEPTTNQGKSGVQDIEETNKAGEEKPKEKEMEMEAFIQAYTDQGIDIDKEEKPFFDMIGAVDGVIFYIEKQKVAIYEYESAKKLEEVTKDNELIKDWNSNGKFLLETDNQKAIEIFNSVK